MTHLVAVGDLVLGDSATSPGFGFNSRYSVDGLAEPLMGVRSAFAAGDIVFGNLEAVLATTGLDARRHHTVHMRGAVRYAADLRTAGFTVLNVANNHANQHGDDAFHEMCDHLQAAGLAVCGLPGADGWCTKPVVLNGTDGETVGLLGYSMHPRQYFPHRPPPFAEATQEEILQEIGRLRSQVTHVVVSIHWGLEFVPAPSEEEVGLGRAMLRAGASVVLGHHPHVVRPVEQSANGVIAYSLGNLVSDMLWAPTVRTGLILACQLGPEGPAELVLTETRLDGQYRAFPTGTPAAVAPSAVRSLGTAQYRRTAAQAERMMRRSKYRHLLANLPSADWSLAAQMLAGVVRGRVVKHDRMSPHREGDRVG